MERQEVAEAEGTFTIGVYPAKDLENVCHEEWNEVKRDRRRAQRERQLAGAVNIFLKGSEKKSAGKVMAAWRMESEGWSRADCVLDSGAADSVCPRTMAPQFPIQDTEASRNGVYYTAADGENQQCGPTVNTGPFGEWRPHSGHFPGGGREPLMSVGNVCEMVNRVLFGAGGGYILNIARWSWKFGFC